MTLSNNQKAYRAYVAERVKELVPIQEAAQYYGIAFNHSGFAICPFHTEKTASFTVHDNYAHCFGCGWHGDVIAFVKTLLGLDFWGAAERLITDFALPVPIGRKMTVREYRAAKRQYAERVKKQRHAEEVKALYNELYGALWDEYARLDKIIMRERPKSVEDITDDYADAVKEINWIEYMIDTEL